MLYAENRWTGPLAIALLLAPVLAGCSGFSIPRIGGGGDEAISELVENRVWTEQEASVPGTAWAWLSSGQVVTTSCFTLPTLAEWHWTGATTITWKADAEQIQAEIAVVGPEELVLLVGPPEAPRVLRLTATKPGALC